jgi:AAA domain/CHC2 zinc finger
MSTQQQSAAYDALIERARSVLIEDEIAHRRIGLKGKVERVGPCPKCGGEDRFSINTAKQVFNCRVCETGGDVIDLVRHLDGVDFVTACTTLAREQPPPKANGKDHAEPREVYPVQFTYQDETGATLSVVARCEYQYPDGSFALKDGKHKKAFPQKRPDPKNPGKWIYDTDGVRIVPYRLPELLEAISQDNPILIVEGEGKVDLLWSWNVPATCNAGGAKKWKPEHSEFLRGADVVILPDNDEPGREHADIIGASLQEIAKSIRTLELPGLGLKGDIIDWAKAGGTVERLHELIAHLARPWQSTEQQDFTEAKSNEQDVGDDKRESIRLSYFSDLTDATPKLWLIKNVIARGETSSWIGPPGAGKSALLGDVCVHGASSPSWRGYRIKQQFGSLYLAIERGDLVKRRMIAHRLRDSLPPDLPIAVSSQVIDLMDRGCVQNIIDAIKQAEDRLSREIGLLVIDTYAKGIAAGGGDESLAKDQNAALANLRRVIDKIIVHIATVGHTGKDESRGERGSNAKLADVDLQVQIGGDTIKTATVKKANDQEQGPLTSFRLEPYDFGPDEDGDPFRTYVLSKEIIPGVEALERPLTDQQRLAIEALTETVLVHGINLPPGDSLPAGLKTVTADQWRAEVFRRKVIDEETTKNPRARFSELRTRLAAKHLIGVRDKLVWLAINEGKLK